MVSGGGRGRGGFTGFTSFTGFFTFTLDDDISSFLGFTNDSETGVPTRLSTFDTAVIPRKKNVTNDLLVF